MGGLGGLPGDKGGATPLINRATPARGVQAAHKLSARGLAAGDEQRTPQEGDRNPTRRAARPSPRRAAWPRCAPGDLSRGSGNRGAGLHTGGRGAGGQGAGGQGAERGARAPRHGRSLRGHRRPHWAWEKGTPRRGGTEGRWRWGCSRDPRRVGPRQFCSGHRATIQVERPEAEGQRQCFQARSLPQRALRGRVLRPPSRKNKLAPLGNKASASSTGINIIKILLRRFPCSHHSSRSRLRD